MQVGEEEFVFGVEEGDAVGWWGKVFGGGEGVVCCN